MLIVSSLVRPRASRTCLAAACLLACASGCADPEERPGTSSEDASTTRRDSGLVDLSVPGDRGYDAGVVLVDASDSDVYTRPVPMNVSADTALRLDPSEPAPLQDVLHARQVDYYVFAAEAGAFYEISTDNHRFSPDNRITILDAAQNELAQNDSGARWSGDTVDARVLLRAESAGDLYVRIESPLNDDDTREDAAYLLSYYHPRVRKVDSDTPGFALESGAATLQHDDTNGYDYVTLLGTGANDTRTFGFVSSSNRVLVARVLDTELAPHQAQDWQRTLLRDGAAHVIGQIERALGQSELHPPLVEAPYEFGVELGSAQREGVFAVDLVLVPDNPREMDDVDNDTLAGADDLPFFGTLPRRGLVLATLPSGDVDHFRVPLAAGEKMSVACEGESGGSVLRGLHADVVDESGNVLASADESDVGLFIDPLTPPLPGTYFVRLSSGTPPVDTPEAAWVRCAVRVGL